MSKTSETKTVPSYRIYCVARNGGKKATWQEIGAAWKHKDGKGFNLQFKALPLEGASVVLRAVEERKADAKSGRPTAGRYAALDAATPAKRPLHAPRRLAGSMLA
jgi:hypothetical protein